MMVGDSLTQDIEGALRVGMSGVLVRRSAIAGGQEVDHVPVIKSLLDLPATIGAVG
jgi:FMN phosphatase YigB (HAD superfamily)